MAGSGSAVAPGESPLPQHTQSYQQDTDPMESLPRLAAVIERQRRELAAARAGGQAADLAAMARGVLMERDGLSAATAARQLADMAAAAGIPVTELAAAVLRLEPPQPDNADDPQAVAADVRSSGGDELVGALAAQLVPRFGVTAVAVRLLEADGALELLGADGLSGTDASRWRRLPPQLDCRSSGWRPPGTTWWESGPPPRRPGGRRRPLGPRCRPRAARPVGPGGHPVGVAEAWWGRSGGSSTTTPASGCPPSSPASPTCSASASRPAPIGAVTPSPAVFATLGEVTGSALVVRPLHDARGQVADFAIMYLSPGYADPAGRAAAEDRLPLTLLEAYPRSTSGDGLFARALRVLASRHAQHAPGLVAAPLSDDANVGVLADLHAVPFFTGVLFTWRVPGEAEQVAEVLDAQRLGSLGGWEEQLAAGAIRWTRDAFGLFGLDPAQASPIPISALHDFVIAADRAAVRRFQEQLLERREPAVAVYTASSAPVPR